MTSVALLFALLVPAPPTSLALSADGKLLFVGLDQHFGRGGGVAAYRRDNGRFEQLARVDVDGGAQSVALTPDGAMLIVATRVGLASVAVAPFAAGRHQRVRIVRDGDAPATNQVVVSEDGRHAFYTNSATATLGVARIDAPTNWDDAAALTVVGHVALDRVPGGVALAPDGRSLYVTSEIDSGDPADVPGARDPRLGRRRCASNLGPSGVLSIVDVANAIDEPSGAVVARVAAGCGPVRVAVSPGGDVAWVTDRGENRVLAFDTARLRNDSEHSLIASIAVGDVPVGLALSPDGRRLLVANSHRSSDPDVARASDLSLVDPAAALTGAPAIVATIHTGALAREVLATGDGTFLVTNYNAKAVDLISLPDALARRHACP
jgi:DNA-binding beta-propeller fold protein YncE